MVNTRKTDTSKCGLKKYKHILPCQICGQISHYQYYGAWSCEGCKQFFRRVVSQRRFYECLHRGQCKIKEGENCRSCRFDRCLFVGMNPGLVSSVREYDFEQKYFLANLERRQNFLQGRKQTTSILQSSPICDEDRSNFRDILNSLTPIERAYKRIWDSSEPMPTEFINKWEGVEGLLGDDANLLAKSPQFLEPSKDCFDKCEFIREIEEHGIWCPSIVNLAIKDWFLCVETAKAIPFFAQLIIHDQMTLLKHIFAPLSLFVAAYYSHAISAKTITRANGLMFISSMDVKKFHADPIISSIARQNFCGLVERMENEGIAYEEFLLLFAILIANSTADNLSARGREFLYNESVRYSTALHKLLQEKYGTLGGTQKFATTLKLLDCAFIAKALYGKFVVYYEVFYEKRDPRRLFPKSLQFCFSP